MRGGAPRTRLRSRGSEACAAAPDRVAGKHAGPGPGQLRALRAHPTDRRFPVHDAEKYRHLLSATYGIPVPADIAPTFETEHIDLTWENITIPRFCILDMEHWGVAVAGYGAAYLYLTALTVPAVADRVHEALADVLDTPSGQYAQLAVEHRAGRAMRAVAAGGCYPDGACADARVDAKRNIRVTVGSRSLSFPSEPTYFYVQRPQGKRLPNGSVVPRG
jgi:hypothetical protein